MNLQGKVALVTGASRGIGRAVALRLAREGALVAVNYHTNTDAAAVVVREIEIAGGEAFAVQADVGSTEQIRRLFQDLDAELTRRRGGPQFDVLVNNAGVGQAGTPETTTEADFDRTFAVNVRGPFFVTQQALPRLRDGGRILNISSGLSRRPSLDLTAYSMTKAALDAFTVLLAAHLGRRGVTANTLAPGWTDTDLTAGVLGDPEVRKNLSERTALGRIGTVEDVAAVAAFLASPDAGWVTGQYVEVSGGFRLV